MAVDMKQTYRRLLEETFGKGNLDALDEVCDESAFRSHDPLTGDSDLRQEKEIIRGYREAFPDLKPTVLSAYADGDTVITHWRMTGTHQKALMGIEPTGARCTVEGISIAKFRSGKLVDDLVQWDALGLMRQLGAAPQIQPQEAGRRGQRQTHV